MEPVNLPFGEQFKKAWDEWLQYRKERRLPKYVPLGLKRTLNGLIRDSENNEQVAVKIIEQSIEKNYQGLFPLKTGYGKTTNPTSVKLGTSEARIKALREWGI